MIALRDMANMTTLVCFFGSLEIYIVPFLRFLNVKFDNLILVFIQGSYLINTFTENIIIGNPENEFAILNSFFSY